MPRKLQPRRTGFLDVFYPLIKDGEFAGRPQCALCDVLACWRPRRAGSSSPASGEAREGFLGNRLDPGACCFERDEWLVVQSPPAPSAGWPNTLRNGERSPEPTDENPPCVEPNMFPYFSHICNCNSQTQPVASSRPFRHQEMAARPGHAEEVIRRHPYRSLCGESP